MLDFLLLCLVFNWNIGVCVVVVVDDVLVASVDLLPLRCMVFGEAGIFILTPRFLGGCGFSVVVVVDVEVLTDLRGMPKIIEFY